MTGHSTEHEVVLPVTPTVALELLRRLAGERRHEGLYELTVDDHHFTVVRPALNDDRPGAVVQGVVRPTADGCRICVGQARLTPAARAAVGTITAVVAVIGAVTVVQGVQSGDLRVVAAVGGFFVLWGAAVSLMVASVRSTTPEEVTAWLRKSLHNLLNAPPTEKKS
jgi:hypothetical protein